MSEYFTKRLKAIPVQPEFNRILNNETISSIGIPYTLGYIDYMISYYEIEEKYENCIILQEYKQNRVKPHDEKYK